MLCGVRLLDKSRDGRENNFRIEIWVKFNSAEDAFGVKMKQYVEEKFLKLLES